MTGAASSPPPATEPTRSGRLLGLVRKLIGYGRQLSTALFQRTADLTTVTCEFGTKDITLILRRIARGLLLASALEARIIDGAARLDAPPERAARAATAARRTPRAAPRPRAAATEPPDPRLERLPSAEEIAAICRDLGILPSHPLWREIRLAVMGHGGNSVALFMDIMRRVLPVRGLDPTGAPPRLPAPAGTGPSS